MVGKEGKTPLTTLRDIEPIRESEARFRSIFENAAVGIARVATDGRFLEVNQRLCDIVGYAAEELTSKTFAEITHLDDLQQDLGAVRRMLAGEFDTYLREKRYYRKDGSVVWVNLSVSLLREADGSAGYFISVIEDISARKRAEEALRASEEKFRVLANTAPVMIWVTEPDGSASFVSRGWCEFTGQTEQEAMGKGGFGWLDVVHPDDREESGRVFMEGQQSRETLK